jgi:hypothetical protein
MRNTFPLGSTRFKAAVLSAGALALVASACTRQGQAYGQSPVCNQAERACKHYNKVNKQAGKDEGAGLDLLREDCEASQRACAESVQNLQPSSYPSETPDRSWRDLLTR